MNFIRRRVERGAIRIGNAVLDLSGLLGDKLASYEDKEIIFGFRPEAATLRQTDKAFALTGVVELTEMLGDNANVYLTIGEEKAILKVEPYDIPQLDTELNFYIPLESVYLFDAETENVIE